MRKYRLKFNVRKAIPSLRILLIKSFTILIWCDAKAVFFNILSAQTKAAFVTLVFRMASYMHDSVEGLRSELLPMALLSCDMEAFLFQLRFSEDITVECSSQIFAFTAELQSFPIQRNAATISSVPLVKTMTSVFFELTDTPVFAQHISSS